MTLQVYAQASTARSLGRMSLVFAVFLAGLFLLAAVILIANGPPMWILVVMLAPLAVLAVSSVVRNAKRSRHIAAMTGPVLTISPKGVIDHTTTPQTSLSWEALRLIKLRNNRGAVIVFFRPKHMPLTSYLFSLVGFGAHAFLAAMLKTPVTQIWGALQQHAPPDLLKTSHIHQLY